MVTDQWYLKIQNPPDITNSNFPMMINYIYFVTQMSRRINISEWYWTVPFIVINLYLTACQPSTSSLLNYTTLFEGKPPKGHQEDFVETMLLFKLKIYQFSSLKVTPLSFNFICIQGFWNYNFYMMMLSSLFSSFSV